MKQNNIVNLDIRKAETKNCLYRSRTSLITDVDFRSLIFVINFCKESEKHIHITLFTFLAKVSTNHNLHIYINRRTRASLPSAPTNIAWSRRVKSLTLVLAIAVTTYCCFCCLAPHATGSRSWTKLTNFRFNLNSLHFFGFVLFLFLFLSKQIKFLHTNTYMHACKRRNSEGDTQEKTSQIQKN